MAQCILMKAGGVNPKGSAQPNDVIQGKTFMNDSGEELSGALYDLGKLDPAIGGISESYPNIPIYRGSNLQMNNSTVSKEKMLAIQMPVGAIQGTSYVGVNAGELGNSSTFDVRAGKTFTSIDGVKIIGSIPDKSGFTYEFTPSSKEQEYGIPWGIHDGNGKFKCKATTSGTCLIAVGSSINWENKTLHANISYVDEVVCFRKDGLLAIEFKKPVSCSVWGAHYHPDQGEGSRSINTSIGGTHNIALTNGYNVDRVGAYETFKTVDFNAGDTFYFDITCSGGAVAVGSFAIYAFI